MQHLTSKRRTLIKRCIWICADMGKFFAFLLVSAIFVFMLWTFMVSNVWDITPLYGGLPKEKQLVNFPERTSLNDTPQKTEQSNKITTLNETAGKKIDEMDKPLVTIRNKMERTHTINNEEEGDVEKQQIYNFTNAGSTMRNEWGINRFETEPTSGDKHIIFIETGCVLNESQTSTNMGLVLNKRQVCAIESAAKMNPDYKVYLLYSCPINGRIEDSSEYVRTIFTYPNVNLWRLETKRHFSKTPLEKWNFKAAIMSSDWPKEHSSDVLRFVTLWKYGGIYLDMDFIILKSLDVLGTNYVSLESPDTVGSSVLSFSWDGMGHAVADRCVEELRTNFRGDIWIHNGPGLITRVLLKTCNVSSKAELSTKICQSFRVLSHREFFPIPWEDWEQFFSESTSKQVMDKIKDSFGAHVWNKLSKNTVVNAGSQQPYSLMAATACPRMYAVSAGNF